MSIETLLNIIKDYAPSDKATIIRAYEFASKAHRGVKRKSGEPYITHPLAVACILAEMHADVDTIVAGLLHDVVEDTDITVEEILKKFNPTVARLVDGVTKLPKFSVNNDKKSTEEANMRKISESIIFDIRIMIIKLADRLHNMRTLEHHKPDKQKEIAQETLDFFVPFANLIGAYTIKLELEDLAFKYIDKEKYQEMKDLVQKTYLEKYDVIESTLCRITQLLNDHKIPFEVKLKIKNYYALAKRLIKNESISNVHDMFALKFILKDIETCYWLRDRINEIYSSVEARGKDYIANPKSNMYRSLHTTVNVDGVLLQFQLKTEEMYMINSYGLTAYWDLLKFNHAPEHMQDDVRKMPFFQSIAELTSNDLPNDEFNREVKQDILSPKIKVLTPKGESVELPVGSTPIDFAYKISTDIGNQIVKAVVNGKVVPFNYCLKDDDQVLIIHDPNFIGPKIDVFPICKTQRAKRRIKEQRRINY